MQCIDLSAAAPPKSKLSSGPELVQCDHFTIRKIAAKKSREVIIPSGEPKVLMFITGRGRLLAAGHESNFTFGDTILLPAGLVETVAAADSDALWLEVRVKNASS